MWEFCLISALGDNENLQALEKINIVTPTSNLSDDAKFTILDFRVGALDPHSVKIFAPVPETE